VHAHVVVVFVAVLVGEGLGVDDGCAYVHICVERKRRGNGEAGET
jgi:hypothetical protein